MIPEVNPYNNYRGDGSATKFDFDFFIQDGSQLIVEKIDKNDVVVRLVENVDYEIAIIDDEIAGFINFPIEDSEYGVLQEDETLSLQLDLPFSQESEYGQSSLLDLNSIEFSLDYLTRLCQILKRQLERSVKVNEGSDSTPTELLETINNNALVSTNAAALASKKADKAIESANIATEKAEEIDGKILGFNEAYEEMVDEITQEGEKQLQNVQSTGFYMRDDKLYFINSKGEEKEFKAGGSGYNLGDTKITDHILEGEEAKGWALQGTYVSGALYPDFYNKYLEKYHDSNNTKKVIKSNVTITGALTDNNGVLSGFAYSVYASLPNAWISENYDTWEMVFDVTTGDDVTTQQFVYSNFYNSSGVYSGVNCYLMSTNFRLALRFSGNDFQVGTYTILPNTRYLIRIRYTGSAYTLEYSTDNGASWEIDINYSSTTKVTTRSEGYFTVGNLYLQSHNDYKNPWLGTIDLKNSYINVNGSRWWTGADTITQNSNKHLFYPISIKSTIDDIYNQYGIADFYGIDEENERIFLPRNKYFQQLTDDVSKVNEMVEAGLPNITGVVDARGGNDVPLITMCSGAFKNGTSKTVAGMTGSGSVTRYQGATFDASRSNSIYGNSDTVQPPSSLKLLYYCVGNTVVNDAEIDAGGLVAQMEQKANIFLDNTMPTEEFANNIVDLSRINAYITESYQSGSSWYRVWSDGWKEQGGKATTNNVTFLKKYNSTPTVVLTINYSSGTRTVNNITNTGFTVGDGGATSTYPSQWLATGK